MEIDMEQEQFLCLRLAIVSEPKCERKPKRKRSYEALNSFDHSSGVCEGKILGLLQMREQMLKLDQKRDGGEIDEHANGLHMIHLLLISATSLDENKVELAVESLLELFEKASLIGDSVQRVASYFADGLVARLLTRKSPFYDMIMKPPTYEEEFLAFMELYKASPFYQFAHFTANQMIMEAFEFEEEKYNKRDFHVIDFDVSYGFQWPSLIQSLSDKATCGTRISLKITGFGESLEELHETELRLDAFARGCKSLVFEFQGVLRGTKLVNIRKKKSETLVANLVFHLNGLSNTSKVFDTLKYVHDLNPSMVVLVEQEGNRSTKTFLSRFMESLHYFAAMFDSLDDCLPIDSAERLGIEKNYLGKEIKRFMNYDKDETNYPKYESMETWKGRMEESGFEGAKLSPKCLMQAKLLLKIRSHCSPIQFDGENSGFNVFERDENNAISLGWQDRCLLTASSWNCARA